MVETRQEVSMLVISCAMYAGDANGGTNNSLCTSLIRRAKVNSPVLFYWNVVVSYRSFRNGSSNLSVQGI